MKLKLLSNFNDYYDHWFDLDGNVFKRATNSGMIRGCMFSFMRSHGLTIPIYGIVQHLGNYLYPDEKVVVYLDENKHCGEGKQLLTLGEAYKLYPFKLCTEYLVNENPFGHAVSYRHLQIGNRAFWIKYISYTDWRSNCGEGDIELIEERKPIEMPNKPLFAVDFVEKNNIYYAIDFNISPGIRGTGIEDIIPPKEVVDLIKEAYFKQWPGDII